MWLHQHVNLSACVYQHLALESEAGRKWKIITDNICFSHLALLSQRHSSVTPASISFGNLRMYANAAGGYQRITIFITAIRVIKVIRVGGLVRYNGTPSLSFRSLR
jgi:hypothetical protein